MLKRIIAILIFVFIGTNLYGQTFDQKNLEKQAQDTQKQMQEQQKQYLDSLKKQDPKIYELAIEIQKRQNDISDVVNSFQSKKISYEEAQSKLYPLVSKDLKDQQSNLDSNIQRVENQLNTLKKSKTDPRYLIEKRIRMMLGKATPEEMQEMAF